MGGRGSGGKRTGSGQKPRAPLERAVSGTVDSGTASPAVVSKDLKPWGVVLKHPGATAVAPVETFEPPADWLAAPETLAPLAAQLAFLTAAQGPGDPNPQIAEIQARVDALQALVDALAVWRELAPHAFAARTLTPGTAAAFLMLCRGVVQERALSADPATASGPNHRGMMHRVATWMKDFNVAPFGKPMYAAEEPAANPLHRFTKPR